MNVKFTEKETKIGKALRRLNKDEKVSFKTGVFGRDNSKMVMIGAVHEFGSEYTVKKTHFVPPLRRVVKAGTVVKIPARRWLSIGYQRNKEFYFKLLKKNLKQKSEGKKSFDELNNEMAFAMARTIKSELGKNMPPALKYRQGTPLIDHGDLKRAIGTKVVTNKKITNTKGYGDD